VFHGQEGAVFQPETCEAVLIAGGTLARTPANVEGVLPYLQASRWFSDSAAAISIGVTDDFDETEWQRCLSVIDSLAFLAVRDLESARILRQAGVRTDVLVCADLLYLAPSRPRIAVKPKGKPVLGILAEEILSSKAEALHGLDSNFEIRHVPHSDFADIDICLATSLQGVCLSVLHGVPFAVLAGTDKPIERECNALGYPVVSDVHYAWSERSTLQDLLHQAKPRRVRLSLRNIELLQTALTQPRKKNDTASTGKRSLVVWAAPDDYWHEAENLLASIDSGFDCLVPSGCQLTPPRARKRMAIPAGTLMHWEMFPVDLKQQIENQYDETIVCHAFRGPRQHLEDIATRTGHEGREFRLWTHSCESFS